MYKNINIFELRMIAREKGVRCPTTLNKPQLIEQLAKVENGEIAPYFKQSGGKGRPVMTTTLNLNNINLYELTHRDKLVKLFISLQDLNKAAKKLADDFGIEM